LRSSAAAFSARAVEVGGALVVAQPGLRSLQTVVNRLRGAEELGLARDHAPVHGQPEIAKQRHAGAQQLRDAAAIGGSVQLEDARTAQRLCRLDQLLEDVRRHHVAVGVE
jgi:hypothetical protein